VVPMSLDGSAAVPISHIPGRRVFYIQLTPQSLPNQVCKQLKARLELLRVQPVSLQLKMPLPARLPKVDRPTHLPGQPLEQAAPAPTLPTPAISAAPKHLATEGDAPDARWSSLDQLVDELDLLDL
jgi:hypothetical protein